MLAVTNPDTVKRICSTLCRAALRPARDVVQAFALRLVFVPLALRLQLWGNENDVSQGFYKKFLHKKNRHTAALHRLFTV